MTVTPRYAAMEADATPRLAAEQRILDPKTPDWGGANDRHIFYFFRGGRRCGAG